MIFEQVIILSGRQEFERNQANEKVKKPLLGYNFASYAHMSSKELLAQSKQGAETDPCINNTNRWLERQM